MSFLKPLARLAQTSCHRFGRVLLQGTHTSSIPVAGKAIARQVPRFSRPLIWGSTLAAAASLTLVPSTIHADAAVKPSVKTEESEDKVLDPDTSIAFPKSIKVPAKFPIPPLTLLGVGVRTVSFLKLKVYSVALYADLENPNLHVPRDLTPEQKVEHIINNTTCVIRIVPTRSTGYTHLRDAFVRALNTRLMKAKQSGALSEEQAIQESSPIRKLSSLFPNASFSKHTALDIFLSAPRPGHPRALVFRDLGSVESDWVATNLVLNYFSGECPSPALKDSVYKNITDFEK